MKTSTLTCLTFALLLFVTRSASAVDVFPYQVNINAAYNAVLDARLKLESSPSFITHETIHKVRSKLAFAKICLENAQKELEAMTGNMSHHERAKELVKSAFEQVRQAGRAGAR